MVKQYLVLDYPCIKIENGYAFPYIKKHGQRSRTHPVSKDYKNYFFDPPS